MKKKSAGLCLPLLIVFAAGAAMTASGSPSASRAAKYSTKELPLEGTLGPDDRKTLFIGNYGETFTFSGRWVLHPPLLEHGIEIVRFHSSWFHDSQAPRTVPESEFGRPVNYTPLKLAQLIVIPKESESFKDLTKLRDAKIADLTAEGVVFSTRTAPIPTSDWPEDAFQVFVTSPYRLHQVYTQSNGNVFVLTDGLGSDASGSFLGTPSAEEITVSLGASLERLNRTPEAAHVETFDYSFSGSRWICLPLLAAGMLLWGLSAKTGILRRLGTAAIAATILSLALRLIGFYLARMMMGSASSADAPIIVIGGGLTTLAFIALLYRSTQLESTPKWIVRGFSTISAVILALALVVTKQDLTADPQSAASKFSLFMFCVGLLDGACLGFSWETSGRGLGSVAILLFLALFPGRAAAQETDDADHSEAARIVDSQGAPIQSDAYRARAIHQLESEDSIFNYPRIEISGIVATDDPNDFAPRMISRSLHPAHNSNAPEGPNTGLLQRIRKTMKSFDNDRKDISDLFDDKAGALTPRGREILAPLMDPNVHVNEIVAHSWGAVLLNNAIRIGAIIDTRITNVLFRA